MGITANSISQGRGQNAAGRGLSSAVRVLAMLGFASLPMLAQGGPAGLFPWWEGQISSELNLSDAQHQQVEGIQREYRGKLIDSQGEMSKAELELDDAMNADPFDLRKATDAANRVTKARDELTKNFTQMGLRMRAVLSKQQWDTARQRSQRFRRGGPGGGPPNLDLREGGPRSPEGNGRGRGIRRGGPGPGQSGTGGPGGPGGPGGGGPGGGPGGPPQF